MFTLLTGLILSVLVWTATFTLDKSELIMGELAPEGRPVLVQSEVQGRIISIDTRVGASVSRGDRLVSLQASDDQAALEESGLRLWQLRVQEARYLAEQALRRSGSFPGQAPRDLVEDQQVALEASLQDLEARLTEIDEQRSSLTAKAASVRALIPGIRNQIRLASARHQMLIELNRAQFEGELAVMEASQALEDGRARLLETEARLIDIEGQVTNLSAARESVLSTFKRDATSALVEVRQELALEGARFGSLRDRVGRYVFDSPVDGLISKVGADNPGQVVQFGHSLVEVIPNGVPISFYGRASPSAISEISEGLPARITLVNMDTRRVQPLDGLITHIDPDATEDEQHGRYYRVTVQLQERPDVDLIPGVTGSAFIRLGERTVLEYLLEPIINALSTALSET